MKTGRTVLTVLLFIVRKAKASSLLLVALTWLAVLMLHPEDVRAQSVLADDAHVSLASRNANHGTNPNLNVSSSENVYLKFKLSSLPSNTPGSEVEKATLNVFVGKVEAAGKLKLYVVAGEWDETEITADNAPPVGSLVTTIEEVGPDQEGKFLAVDITSLVQQWLGDDGQGANGLPNYGIAIIAADQIADLTFDSKENSQTSHEAQLTIQLRRATGLQRVATDPTLRGDGTSALPLGVAPGAINTVHLANNAVTGGKIADGAVTSSELANGAATGAKIKDGAITSAKVTSPLVLNSADPTFTLSVINTGAGAALAAAGPIDTTTQYNIGGQRVLSIAGLNNTFAGVGAGQSNTTGDSNSFFGLNAGVTNNQGSRNSFFGVDAGRQNSTGRTNSFFGFGAGQSNTEGEQNSFFGGRAGLSNTTGGSNSFFGSGAGADNTTGRGNSYFGAAAGLFITTGEFNAFFGFDAGGGSGGGTGSHNAFFGALAGQHNTGGSDNSFFGFGTGAGNKEGNGNSFFGRNAGDSNTMGSSNSFFGINAGTSNTTGDLNSSFGQNAGGRNTSGVNNTFVGSFAGLSNTIENENTFIGANANGFAGITNASAIGANAFVAQSNSLVLGHDNVSVGIGTFAPKTKLHVVGKVYVEAAGQGVILKSPSGACFELTVTNAGALTATAVACP
jgi:hypothetical protein